VKPVFVGFVVIVLLGLAPAPTCRLAFCAIKSQVCVKVAATELAVRS
jgi:hypothetical protein